MLLRATYALWTIGATIVASIPLEGAQVPALSKDPRGLEEGGFNWGGELILLCLASLKAVPYLGTNFSLLTSLIVPSISLTNLDRWLFRR